MFQPYEEPLYDGKQAQWVLETSDLNAYLGEIIQLRFLISTDGYVFKDGFYFDDFKVITIKEETVSSVDIDEKSFAVYPNPASLNLNIELPTSDDLSISIYNSLGYRVYSANAIGSAKHELQTAGWPSGLYHYVIQTAGSTLQLAQV